MTYMSPILNNLLKKQRQFFIFHRVVLDGENQTVDIFLAD